MTEFTPPPELVKEWVREANHNYPMFPQVALEGVKWGSERERKAREELRSGLADVIARLEGWCDTWHPDSYTDPRISLRRIAGRGRVALEADK